MGEVETNIGQEHTKAEVDKVPAESYDNRTLDLYGDIESLNDKEVQTILSTILLNSRYVVENVGKVKGIYEEDFLEGEGFQHNPEGGLAISYYDSEEDRHLRFIMGYNEIGEWVYFNDYIDVQQNP